MTIRSPPLFVASLLLLAASTTLGAVLVHDGEIGTDAARIAHVAPGDSLRLKGVLEPFTVPYEENGKKQIMYAQFSLNLSNKDAMSEIEENIVVMREAIYIYISRREKGDFADEKKRAEILDDLKNLLDRSLLNGRVQDVLITQLNFF